MFRLYYPYNKKTHLALRPGWTPYEPYETLVPALSHYGSIFITLKPIRITHGELLVIYK